MKKSLLSLSVLSLAGCGTTSVDLMGKYENACGASYTRSFTSQPSTAESYFSRIDDMVKKSAQVNARPRSFTSASLGPIKKEDIDRGIQVNQNLYETPDEGKLSEDARNMRLAQARESREARAVLYVSGPTSVQDAIRAREQINALAKKYLPPDAGDNNAAAESTMALNIGSISAVDAQQLREINETMNRGGYDALKMAALGRLFPASIEGNDGAGKQEAALPYEPSLQDVEELTTADFIRAYFKAYFRDGRFLEATLDTDSISNSLINEIKPFFDKLPDAQKQKINEQISSAIPKKIKLLCRANDKDDACYLAPSPSSKSFVTRYGQTVQFSGVSVSIGGNGLFSTAITNPSSTEYGPQLARVLLEALFDSRGIRVPAVATATACTVPPPRLYAESDCLSTADTQKNAVVSKIDSYASQAESLVSSQTAALIRGGSVLALNNEALAKVVETTTGVIARKTTEKALWRHYRKSTCEIQPGTMSISAEKPR